jgi:hypothetical protein
VVLARTDIIASDGGRRRGEDEIVVVIRERRMLVSGRIANGADSSFLDVCSTAPVATGRSTAPGNVRLPDGEDWLEDEWRARLDAFLALIRETRRGYEGKI